MFKRKRVYAPFPSNQAKRPRFSAVSRYKKTYTRPRPNYRRRYRVRRKTNYRRRRVSPMLNVMKHVHIPCTVRVSNRAKAPYRYLGQKHTLQWWQFAYSSSVTGKNSPWYRFMASISHACTSAEWSSPSFYGEPHYSAAFPSGSRRYLYVGLKMNILFTFLENARVRLCIARPKRGETNNQTDLFGWNGDVDQIQNTQKWSVLYTKWFNNSNTTTGTIGGDAVSTQSHQTRSLNLYFPVNRVMETLTKVNATQASDWIPGTAWEDFTYLIFDSDDATSGDSQYVIYKVQFSAVFYQLA